MLCCLRDQLHWQIDLSACLPAWAQLHGSHWQACLKDSFEFAKIICEEDAGLFMASLDVDSLFTNVPLEETIRICVNELFKSNSSIHGLNKKQITKMLSWMNKESIILFDMVFYTQVDGVAIGSPLSPSLANAFLCHHEMVRWLSQKI